MRIILCGLALSVAMGLLTACQDGRSVKTHSVPKEVQPPTSMSSPHGQSSPELTISQGQAQGHGTLHWKTPQDWQEKPSSSSIRLASFMAPGKDGNPDSAADVSIVVLAGQAGGVIANVNRWREQVGLGPLNEGELEKVTQRAKGALGPFAWFKIINDANPSAAIFVASIAMADQVVFVKMAGPEETLVYNQSKFVSLCQSLAKR
ncbi:MAG: hypothetical protein HYU97_05295 [Deltaproteobacteria bacterium]|nr:hypothetical protein [Deltaproteobacteria bacterium]